MGMVDGGRETGMRTMEGRRRGLMRRSVGGVLGSQSNLMMLWMMYFCFISTLGTIQQVVEGLEIVNSTYQVKKLSVLGFDATLGVFEVNFDQPLKQLVSYNCPYHIDEATCRAETNPLANPCGDCDFSKRSTCDDKNSPEARRCPSECKEQFCTTDPVFNDWIPLKPGVTEGFAARKKYTYYRFYVDDPCKVLVIDAFSKRGDPDFYLSTTQLQPNKDEREFLFPQYIQFCPGDEGYVRGTYFLAVYGYYEVDFKFNFFFLEDKWDQGGDEEECEEVIKDVECLQDGVPVTTEMDTEYDEGEEPDEFTFYTFTMELKPRECKQVDIWVLSDGESEPVLTITDDKDDYTFRKYGHVGRWSANDDGPEHIALSFCGTEQTTKKVLYIGSSTEDAGSITTVVSTKGRNFRYRALKDYFGPDDGFRHMIGASRLDCRTEEEKEKDEDTNVFQCTQYSGGICDQFWTVWPENDLEPWFPLARPFRPLAVVYYDRIFTLRSEWDFDYPNRFVGVVLLDWTRNRQKTTNLSEKQLGKCTLEMNGKITNSKGETPPTKISGFKKYTPPCDYEDLQRVLNFINTTVSELDRAQSTYELYNLLTQIDTATVSDAWGGCRSKTDDLLQYTKERFKFLDDACYAKPESKAWEKDPCCNPTQSWYQCCTDREVSVSADIARVGNLTRRETRQCGTPGCINSYLEDYKDFLNLQQNPQTACAPVAVYDFEFTGALAAYQNCSSHVFGFDFRGKPCSKDSHCQEADKDGFCDIVTRRCNVNLEKQERQFLKCFVDRLDPFSLQFFSDLFKVKTNEELVKAIDNHARGKDCSSDYFLEVDYRDHVQFEPDNPGCIDECSELFGDVYHCPDTSCWVHPMCIASQDCEREWVFGESIGKRQCEDSKVCNWNRCLGLDSDECKDLCLSDASSSSHFCGFCKNDTYCEVIDESITMESQCDDLASDKWACLKPDGSWSLTDSKEECEKSYGWCTTQCYVDDKKGCSSAKTLNGLCYSENISQDDCEDQLGTFDEDTAICVFPYQDQFSCLNTGLERSFARCESLSNDECKACEKGEACPVPQTLLQCYRSHWRECRSKDECDDSGICEESISAKRIQGKGQRAREPSMFENRKAFPPVFGGCFIRWKKFLEEDDVGSIPDMIGRTKTFAFCQAEYGKPFTTVADGCLDARIESKSDCEEADGTWITPVLKESQCNGFHGTGCDPVIFPLLNNLDPEQCDLCQHDSHDLYKWVPGKWVSAKAYRPKWIKKEMPRLRSWRSTLNFTTLNDLVQRSLAARTSTVGKTNAFCRYSVLTETISTVACDCADGEYDTKSCYSTRQTFPVGTDTPCAGVMTSLTLPSGRVVFQENSIRIEDQCLKTVVLVLPKDQFQQEIRVPAKLSSVFVSSPDGDDGTYEPFEVVKNDNGAIVGEIIASGLQITLEGKVENVTVCFNLRGSGDDGDNKDKYPVYDIAFSSKDFRDIRPQKVDPNPEVDSTRVCIEIPELDEELIAVPIRRSKTADKDELDTGFTTGEKIYFYIVASLFLTNVILSAAFLGFILFLKIAPNYYLRGFLLLILLFNLVRSITYYLLPEEIITDAPVAVFYLMVELPTLIFLSAFTIVVFLWLVAAKTKKIQFWKWFILCFNIFIYLVFLVLILLYHYLPGDEAEKPSPEVEICGRGVVPPPPSGRSSNQEAVLITYRIFVASMALLVALAVISYGIKINVVLAAAKDRRLMVKITVTAAVCALSFILQAVLLLVTLAVDLEPYVTTSLIIVIEVLPSFVMMVMILPDRKPKKKSFRPTIITNNNNTVGMASGRGSISITLSKSSSSSD